MSLQRQWQALRSLTVASVKMYFRNVSALFFTLFIPVMLVLIFGWLNTGNGSKFELTLTNYSQSDIARGFADAVKKVDAFKVTELSEGEAMDKLGKGKVDLVVVIPQEFGTFSQGKPVASKVSARFNEGKPQSGTAAGLILGQITNGFNNALTKAPEIVGVELKGVKTNNLGVIDYLIPGIIAMSIMQLGILSVAFAFVSLKTTGALRRLQATPTRPLNFIIAQSISRLIIGILQVALLLGLGVAVFHLHMVGSFIQFGIAATFGVIVFLAFGFTVAGWAKDENQAAPIANLVTFPMLFLSGVFFPRDGFPQILKTITDYFPLTFLADALRRIANEGATLVAVRGDMLGLAVWGVVMFFVAVLVFRWE